MDVIWWFWRLYEVIYGYMEVIWCYMEVRCYIFLVHGLNSECVVV